MKRADTTAYRLNPSQLAAWVRYFMDPAMTVLAAEPFKRAVRAMVEKDKWPAIDNGPVVIRDESS